MAKQLNWFIKRCCHTDFIVNDTKAWYPISERNTEPDQRFSLSHTTVNRYISKIKLFNLRLSYDYIIGFVLFRYQNRLYHILFQTILFLLWFLVLIQCGPFFKNHPLRVHTFGCTTHTCLVYFVQNEGVYYKECRLMVVVT